MITSLIILCIIFDLGYLYFGKKNKNYLALFSKTFAALCFIIIGYMSLKINESSFALGIFIGMLFDGVGDFLLAIRNINHSKRWFIIGGFSFLIGHILYISSELDVAFSIKKDSMYLFILLGILLGLCSMFIILKICNVSKAYKIFGHIYAPAIFCVFTLALYTYLNFNILANLVFLIGAAMFVSSDMILIINNFGMKKKWMHPTYSLLYFVGQLMIACSLHI